MDPYLMLIILCGAQFTPIFSYPDDPTMSIKITRNVKASQDTTKRAHFGDLENGHQALKCSPASLTKNGEIAEADSDFNMEEILGHLNFSDYNNRIENMDIDEWMKTKNWTQDDAATLKVILVPHSHSDPGWLETIDGYYNESTRNTLNLMLQHLSVDPKLTFIWEEISFFSMWWEELSEVDRVKVKKIVANKQLEFVTGGWVMADEACPSYFSLVTQLMEGHQWLKQHLDYQPKNGWTIDPFGMSPVPAYLMRRAGLNNLVMNRIHYAVKRYLLSKNSLEFKWRQSWDSTGSVDMLAHVMPYSSYTQARTCGPNMAVCCQFEFSLLSTISSPYGRHCANLTEITPENVHERAQLLVDAYRRKSLLFKSNTLLVSMGADFTWKNETEWKDQFRNYKKLIHHIQHHPATFNMELTFGSLEDYFQEVNKDIAARKWTPSSLTGDFFTYADDLDNYWSGYYTSRPFHKRAERELAATLRGAQIAFSIMMAELSQKNGNPIEAPFAQNLMRKIVNSRRHLSLFQHHDGITGTSREAVAADSARRLFEGIQNCEHVMQQSLYILTNLRNQNFALQNVHKGSQFMEPILSRDGPFSFAKLRTISFDKNEQEVRTIVVFNSEANVRVHLVHLRLTAVDLQEVNFVVNDSEGIEAESEIFPVFDHDGQISKTQLRICFLVTMGSLETKRFSITKSYQSSQSRKSHVAKIGVSHHRSQKVEHGIFGWLKDLKDPLEISNHHLKLQFNHITGYIESAFFEGIRIPFRIQFLAYRNTTSGMYLFHPRGGAEDFTANQTGFQPKIFHVRGKLHSYVEVWLPQVKHRISLYNHLGPDSNAIHVDNTVDVRDEKHNFELIMRVQTEIESRDRFYTDLNGFQMVQRKRLQSLPLQGNYYPVPSSTYIEDSNLRMSILSGQPLGGSSLTSGQLELMLDRRLYTPDNLGLDETPKDNLETLSTFQIMLEIPSCSPAPSTNKDNVEKNIPSLSLLAAHQLHSLLNPLHGFTESTKQRQQQKPDLSNEAFDHKIENSGGLPCDIQLVGLFPQSTPSRQPFTGGTSLDLVTPEVGLMVRRVGFDSRFQNEMLKRLCETTNSDFSVRQIFGDLVQSNVSETTLNFVQRLNDIGVNYDDNLSLKRMELSNFLVTYANRSGSQRNEIFTV